MPEGKNDHELAFFHKAYLTRLSYKSDKDGIFFSKVIAKPIMNLSFLALLWMFSYKRESKSKFIILNY